TQVEKGQGSHQFPQFLPDGQHFIYSTPTENGVYAGSLDGKKAKRLTSADSAAVVSPTGFLLFPRQTTLFAQSFDFKRQELSGDPFSVAENVAEQLPSSGARLAPGFSATSGIVAYRAASVSTTRQLTWLDRSGKNTGTIGAAESTGLRDVELSPDGKRIALYRTLDRNSDVWLIDAVRGVPTRFTFDAALD